ncbi:MAG TPA: hypothetical protein VKE88_01125 [Candidatus Nanoarchaeia archaeon]|nr:hypothetical protein [Candidatus Nanoarchaeia archaeon]
MEDIFKDPVFAKQLYGGVKDLDPDVGTLIYKIYNLPFINTGWSCSGHIGKSIPQEMLSTKREGYFVYLPGNMKFIVPKPNPLAEEFMKKTLEIVDRNRFSSLKKDKEKDEYWLLLEMEDLLEPHTEEGTLASFDRDWVKRHEIREELAIPRYESFKNFWKELETVVDGYKSHHLQGASNLVDFLNIVRANR